MLRAVTARLVENLPSISECGEHPNLIVRDAEIYTIFGKVKEDLILPKYKIRTDIVERNGKIYFLYENEA